MEKINKQNDDENKITDLNHLYYIVIALNKDAEQELIDCHFYDDNGRLKDNYLGMCFNEEGFLLLENYLFNFINAECDLLINMYEEEWAEVDQLPKILEITDRMLVNSDNKEFLTLAKEFRSLVVKAIDLNTFIGFCF